MLQELTTKQLQQQLDCAKSGINIANAPTEFELHKELCKRLQRPIIQDEQEDIDNAKAWTLANTEQGI